MDVHAPSDGALIAGELTVNYMTRQEMRASERAVVVNKPLNAIDRSATRGRNEQGRSERRHEDNHHCRGPHRSVLASL